MGVIATETLEVAKIIRINRIHFDDIVKEDWEEILQNKGFKKINVSEDSLYTVYDNKGYQDPQKFTLVIIDPHNRIHRVIFGITA